MKLSNQLTSLKLSQKLEKLGVKQDSYWSWIKGKSDKEEEFRLMDVTQPEGRLNLLAAGYKIYSAFSVAELGELLPMLISGNTKNEEAYLYCHRSSVDWSCGYVFGVSNGIDYACLESARTEANARAKMLIYLIENKLVL